MNRTLQLTCFRISNGAAAVSKLPSRLKLLSWGVNKSVKGEVIVGPKTLARLAANQATLGYDRIALDYEHNTVEGTPAFKASTEPRKVAAYGIPTVIENDGLYLDSIVYTPSGRDYALEYIDLSPAVRQDDEGEVDFMHSAALCRQGAVEDLTYYSVQIPEPEENNMDIKTLSAQVEAQADTIKTLTATIETQQKKITDLLTLSATLKTLQTEVAEISADQDKAERKRIVEKAAAEGKKIPLDDAQIQAMDIPTLQALVDKLEPSVPVTRLTPHTVRDPAGHVVAMNSAAVRNLAVKLQASENISWHAAWARAEAELYPAK